MYLLKDICYFLINRRKNVKKQLKTLYNKDKITIFTITKIKIMKQVIRIPDNNNKQEKVLKPIEFTHQMYEEGFVSDMNLEVTELSRVVYLGKCEIDGDMFVGYKGNQIILFKGHLNDGVY